MGRPPKAIPLLTRTEHTILLRLAADGPSPMIAPQIRGVLALYALIDETPHGWTITRDGRTALLKPPASSRPSAAAEESSGRRRPPGKGAHQRISPFS